MSNWFTFSLSSCVRTRAFTLSVTDIVPELETVLDTKQETFF